MVDCNSKKCPYRYASQKKSSLFIDHNDEQISYANSIIDDSATAEDELIIEQNLAQLLLCIKELKPAYQEVIQMRYFQEMSYQEMADQLQEPLNNIKIKLLRGKKLLAEIIKKS